MYATAKNTMSMRLAAILVAAMILATAVAPVVATAKPAPRGTRVEQHNDKVRGRRVVPTETITVPSAPFIADDVIPC